MKMAMSQDLAPGLYIVATPIGNLSDISARAAAVLAGVDLVACEDTRVTAKLLNHLAIRKRMLRYDDHSTAADRQRLIGMLHDQAVALVSDAGTPLISDPGYKLVREARAAGAAIHTVPGPSAVIAALTLAGLPTDRFYFHGFLPAKAQARAQAIAALKAFPATLVFYETGPRLGAALAALADGLGDDREAAVVREISKRFEEVRGGSLVELAAHYADNPPKGEIVLVVGPPGDEAEATVDDAAVQAALDEALSAMPPGKAAGEVARRFGLDRKALYQQALARRGDG